MEVDPPSCLGKDEGEILFSSEFWNKIAKKAFKVRKRENEERERERDIS